MSSLSLKDRLEKMKILIVDKNMASRSRVRKCLINLGVKSENTFVSGDYKKAIDIMIEHKPDMILSDYIITGGSGFDLFREFKLRFPELKEVITVLITSNISQSTVARAAEEDVDSFLIKPYTTKGLEENILKAIKAKFQPSAYMVQIDHGKDLLFSNQYERAMEAFDKAIPMHKSPSLALFYRGQAQFLLKMTTESETDYRKGLEVNKIHYKCQIGLYEVLSSQKRYEEAYIVVRNVAKYFPANPERLAEVVRLCVVTESFHDMLEYYNLYTALEERTEELARHVSAGLYVAGKFQMMNNNAEGASLFFKKVAVSFPENANLLEAIVLLLIDKGMFEQAQDIFRRFPLGLNDGRFEVLEYLLGQKRFKLYEKISKGEYIFKNVKKDYQASLILLDSLQEKGDTLTFDKYFEQMVTLWPSLKQRFKKAS